MHESAPFCSQYKLAKWKITYQADLEFNLLSLEIQTTESFYFLKRNFNACLNFTLHSFPDTFMSLSHSPDIWLAVEPLCFSSHYKMTANFWKCHCGPGSIRFDSIRVRFGSIPVPAIECGLSLVLVLALLQGWVIIYTKQHCLTTQLELWPNQLDTSHLHVLSIYSFIVYLVIYLFIIE